MTATDPQPVGAAQPADVEKKAVPDAPVKVGESEEGRAGVEPMSASRAGLNPVTVFSACMVTGFAFGFFFEKSHVYEPRSIRRQFVFEQWTMMKMFMGAVTASCLVFSILSIVSPKAFQSTREAFPPPKRGWFTGGLLGGAILGGGMVVSGACPGMVLPQVGTALPNSLLTLAGGLFGAIMFGLGEPVLKPKLLAKGPQCDTSAQYLYVDQFLVQRGWKVRYAHLAIPFGLGCAAFGLLLELLVDYRSELGDAAYEESEHIFDMYAWPPSLCGFLLGCIQLPLSLIIGDSLGSTRGYMCLVSQWVGLSSKAGQKLEYMESHRKGIMNWWQVVYCAFAVLGAFVSGAISGNVPTSANGVDVASALIGGFLMIFGARVAGSCTSGHGISGMPLLHGLSIMAVCGMFGFGIVLGFIMKFAGVLEV